jgi:serine/threonine protein kinase
MAEVYLAVASHGTCFHKLQALKCMRTDVAADVQTRFLNMFEREARLAALLDHPNIVHANEIGSDQGCPFLAMEYLEGQSLSVIQKRWSSASLPAFPVEMRLYVLCQVLEALGYAHQLTDHDGTPLCVVHRDVSPQNIFITYTGQVKLLDFGIAKTADGPETGGKNLAGKVGYMAPEQLRCEQVDLRSDLFSVGVLLWEMLAERRLYEDATLLGALRRAQPCTAPSVREAAPWVSQTLAAVVTRALAWERPERYPDAYTFLRDLEAHMASLPRVTPRHVGERLGEMFAAERTERRELIRLGMTSSSEPSPLLTVHTVDSESKRHVQATLVSAVQPSARESAGMVDVRASIFTLRVVAVISALLAFAGLLAATGLSISGAGRQAVRLSAARGVETASMTLTPTQTARLRVHTIPQDAVVTLDGRSLGGAVYETLPVDGATHTLTASAAGYLSHIEVITLRSDLDVYMDLAIVHEPVAGQGCPRARAIVASRPAKHADNQRKIGALRAVPRRTSAKRARSPDFQLDPWDPWKAD